MTEGEKPFARNLADSIKKFIQIATEGQANNFTLEGPVNIPIDFSVFAALIFDPEQGEIFAHLTLREDHPLSKGFAVHNKILDLKIPDRISHLGIRDDMTLTHAFKLTYARLGMPYMVIGFGKTRQAGEEVAILFSVPGISPKKALSDMQEAAKNRINSFN